MFGHVLEKILLNVVGPYVEGIDRKNLEVGLWKGNISISNISLKQEVVNNLDFPLQMKYSTVGKLSVSVPWKHLGSKPVEIILEDVALVVEPKSRETWQDINFRTADKKLQMMDSFMKTYMAKLIQKRKENKGIDQIIEKEDSLVGKLSIKAIDNVQISVRNIHARFEDPFCKRPYSWGITLDEVLVNTTNEKWETQFIDRTLSENKMLPMRKKFLLKNAGLYWNSDCKEFYGDLLPAAIHQKMKQEIQREDKGNYIINLSAECRLTQRNKKDLTTEDEPAFDLSLELAPIDVLLLKTQVEDIVHLVELYNDYERLENRMINQSKKQAAEEITKEEATAYREEFKMLFMKIQLKDEEEGLQNMEKVEEALDGPEQAQHFEELLLKLPDEDIALAVKQALKELEMDRLVTMLEQKEKEKEKEIKKSHSKRSALMGWFKKKAKGLQQHDEKKEEDTTMDTSVSSTSSFWDNEEMEKVEKYIEDSFPTEEEVKASQFKNFLSFNFVLQKGSVYLCNVLGSGHEEGLIVNVNELTVSGSITNETKKIDISLQDLAMNLRTKYATSYSYLDAHILRRVDYWLPYEKSGSLATISYEENPDGKKVGACVDIKLQQVEIVYRKALIDRLKDYFAPAIENAAIKAQYERSQAIEGAPQPKTVQQEEQKPMDRLYLSVDIDAPVIVVPLLQNGDVKSECWVLNLGHLVVGSMDPMTNEGLLYELYDVALMDVRFEYYPSQALYMKIQRSLVERGDLSGLNADEEDLHKKTFNLIEKFSISVKAHKMLPGMQNTEEGKRLPKMDINVTVPIIHLQLRADCYKSLLKVPALFDFEGELGEMEMIENERETLLVKNDKVGSLYVQEKKLGKLVWTKCDCILKDNYLYLFKHAEDQRPAFTYYIVNSALTDCENTDKKFAFCLENKHNKGCLAGESEEERQEWLQALVDKIDENSKPNIFRRSKVLKKKKTKKPEDFPEIKEINYEEVETKVYFQIKELKVALFHIDNAEKKLIELDTKNFQAEIQKQPSMTTIHTRLESLEINDFLFEFTNPDLKSLATSVPPMESQFQNADLVEIQIVNVEHNHPKYNEILTNTQVNVKFGYLYVNFKPEVVGPVMKFLMPVEEQLKDAEKPPQERRKTTVDNTTIKKETTYTESLTNTIMNVQIGLREVGVRLIHMKSHACMAEMAVKDVSLMLRQKPYLMEFEGVLGNIQLLDTTNYPNTTDSNLEFTKIKKYELLGAGEKSQNLLEISFKQYDPQHPEADNKSHKHMFADIKMGSIQVNFLMKPIFRLIDYVQGQLVPAVTPPEGAATTQKNEGEEESALIVQQISQEEAMKTLEKPSFLELKVHIGSPIVHVKPLPDSKEYLEIKLGDVTVDSDVYADYTRLKNPASSLDFVYCQKFDVKLQNMGFFRVNGLNKGQMSEKVNFDVLVDMPTLLPEYKSIYHIDDESEEKSKEEDVSSTKMDEKMVVKGRMSPLIVTLDHEDLMLMMKIMNKNISHDDGMDRIYESITMQPQAKPQQKRHKESEHEGGQRQEIESEVKEATQPEQAPFKLDFTFENFTVLALDKLGLPFAMINLYLLQIDMHQKKHSLKGNVKAYELNGTYFERGTSTLTEKRMLGMLDRAREHHISGKRNDVVIKEIMTALTEHVATLKNKSDKIEPEGVQINVGFDVEPSGKKIVRADLNELKVYLVPDIYVNLLKFLEMEDAEANPDKSKEEEEKGKGKEKGMNMKGESSKSEKSGGSEGDLRLEIAVKNILVTLPASNLSINSSPYALALRTDIMCGLDMNAPPSLDKALTGIKDKHFERAIEQRTEHNEIMHLKATVTQCEVFICDYEELITANEFSDVRKRHLILPFTMSFTRIANMVPNKYHTELIQVAKNDASMEMITLRVSYQDALLLNNTVEHQLELLGGLTKDAKKKEEGEKIKKLSTSEVSELEVESTRTSSRGVVTRENFEESKEEEDPREQVQEAMQIQEQIADSDVWDANQEEFELESQGLQIVLINDAEGNLTPVVELNVQDIAGSVFMVNGRVNLSSLVYLSCSYFNPLPSKWEPIIEKIGFAVETTVAENPKLTVSFATANPYETVNINISEEMLTTIYSTMTSWKSDYERKIIKQDKDNIPKLEISGYGNEKQTGVEVEDELIDYVSPYTLVNLTGYPIEVETDTATPHHEGKQKKPAFARSKSKKLQEFTNKTYRIPNQEKTQYLVESNIEDLFKKSVHDTMVGINHIAVKIKHPDYDIDCVAGIDIDRARVTSYKLDGKAGDGTSLATHNLRLFSDISLEKNTKAITLSSPYRFINRTHMAYTIVLEHKEKLTELNIEPGKTIPVPIDLADAAFSLKTDESEGSISIKRLLHDFNDKPVDFVELQVGDTFVLAESVRRDAVAPIYEISLQPTFSVKNCCGLEVLYRITADIDEDPTVRKLNAQEVLHESKISQRQHVFLQMRVQGFLWSEKVKVHTSEMHGKNEHEIKLMDAAGGVLTVYLYCPENETGTKKFILYTKACIVNETPYELKFSVPGDKQRVQMPGQLPVDESEKFISKILLTNETKRLAISHKGHNEHSGIINIGAIGSSYVELNEENHHTMLELGLDMKVVQCDKEYQLLTKVITINPRYILVNKTQEKIEIRRDGGTKNPIVLDKDAREAFQWSDWGTHVKEKSIVVRLQDSTELDLWAWSRGFDITSVGEYHFLARSKDKSHVKFLKSVVTIENSTVFVIVEEENKTDTFRIRNDCPGLDIRVSQEGANMQEGTVIRAGDTIAWSWEFPSRKQEIVAEFCYDETGYFTAAEQNFKFETLNQVQKLEMPESFKEVVKRIYCLVVMDGNSRVMTFFTPDKGKTSTKNRAMQIIEEAQRVGRSGDKPVFNLNLDVRLGGIGVSVISKLMNKETKRKERREIAYLWLGGVEAKLIDSKDSMTAQFRLKFLNLDNNAMYDTSFPVLLTPEKPLDLAVGTRNYLMDVLVEQKKTNDIMHFETIQFLLAELCIRVDGLFLDVVLETVNNFMEIFRKNELISSDKTITEALFSDSKEAKKLEDPAYFNSKFSWISRPIPQLNSNLFINTLIVYPIFVNLSFQFKKLDLRENLHFAGNLLASVLGSTIANLDNAPIQLKGFRLEHVFDSQEAILKKILDKVQDDAIKSVLKLFGSLDIIGNPVGLFNNISTGVIDLFEKPIEGFLEGPLEGGKGMLEGAGSLVKNTVYGTFNTVGKITGSLASGVSNLAMDDEYLAAREQARLKRPAHFGQGLYQGLTALLRGLGYGVKGVVTQPVEGAEKEGVSGLLKGTAKGVTGLIAKPVTGILDAASKTAEGVKNTAMMFDQKPNNMRVRHPRAFYGVEKFYRTYMDTDAEILSLLHENGQHKYKGMSLINTFDVYPDDREHKNVFIVALAYEHILCWDVKHAKLQWAVHPREVRKITLYQNGIQLDLPNAEDTGEEQCVAVENYDVVQNEYIAQRIAQLKKYVD